MLADFVQEVAEPLMDLKKGVETLHSNKTFRCILSAVLAIGNFLNGSSVRIQFLFVSKCCVTYSDIFVFCTCQAMVGTVLLNFVFMCKFRNRTAS